MSTRFTLGVVSYLNALPLYRTLETRGQVRVRREVPARLAALLESGQCDAAIMPVVDFLRGTGQSIISDACIGTKTQGDGAVRSVLLFHRAPPGRLQSVAVDTSSHSSVALLRILLADAYGILPPFVPHAPNLAHMLDRHEGALLRILLADAYGVLPPFVPHAPNLAHMLNSHEGALLIGDAALEAKGAVEVSVDRPENHILDLGAAWKRLTGLPFVFAAWIARRDLSEAATRELGEMLNAARDEGVANLPTIVAQNPFPSSLASAQIEEYLREAVEFHFSDAHRIGLEEFRHRCEKYDLLRDKISDITL